MNKTSYIMHDQNPKSISEIMNTDLRLKKSRVSYSILPWVFSVIAFSMMMTFPVLQA